jgi:ABC-type antimicrobial peptide transport system permease subunit
MGVKNLWRRKLRTFLTVLGVIIGTSSIIVMLSLGFGMTEAFQSQIEQMGSLTTITVSKGGGEMMGGGMVVSNSMGGSKDIALDDKAVESFKKLPNVKAVTPMIETYGTLVNGKYQSHTSIKGIDPDVMEEFDFKIAEGRILNNMDDLVAIYGGEIKRSFYDPNSSGRGPYREPKIDLMTDRIFFTFDQSYGSKPMPGEKRPVYKEYKLKTAGILEEGDFDKGWSIYLPIKTLQKMMIEKDKAENVKPQSGQKKSKDYQTVLVKVDDMKYVQTIQQELKDMGHEAYSLNDWLDEMKKTAGIFQAVLGGIGAVSLLVAAIGITNTMVMSIYERTKEIGVMKVIGASIRDIKRLFLFESALIGLLGGILGVGFSLLLSFIANKFGAQFGNFMGTGGETKISIIPIWLSLAAMGFSALIGVLSGYYPAKRAMSLSALEAIRTE